MRGITRLKRGTILRPIRRPSVSVSLSLLVCMQCVLFVLLNTFILANPFFYYSQGLILLQFYCHSKSLLFNTRTLYLYLNDVVKSHTFLNLSLFPTQIRSHILAKISQIQGDLFLHFSFKI